MDICEIAAKLRKAGRDVNYPNMALTQQLLAPQHETEPYHGISVIRDRFYGPNERHRLDVFMPETPEHARPILLFVHGGGFVRGDKRVPGAPYNDNVGLFAARNGMIGVTMTHRLAPEHRWPAGGSDVAAAIAWLAENSAAMGGDPARIVAAGTSAGATHVASAIALGTAPLAGAILLSGIYDFADPAMQGILEPYLEPGMADPAACSPGPALVDAALPLMLVMAELDPPEFERQTFNLAARLFDRHGQMPHLLRLPGHNHFSAALHLNGQDRWLGQCIADFVARCT